MEINSVTISSATAAALPTIITGFTIYNRSNRHNHKSKLRRVASKIGQRTPSPTRKQRTTLSLRRFLPSPLGFIYIYIYYYYVYKKGHARFMARRVNGSRLDISHTIFSSKQKKKNETKSGIAQENRATGVISPHAPSKINRHKNDFAAKGKYTRRTFCDHCPNIYIYLFIRVYIYALGNRNIYEHLRFSSIAHFRIRISSTSAPAVVEKTYTPS